MTHPLHKPCPIAEWTYVYGLTVLTDDGYWDIHLNETEESNKFTKRHIWTTETDELSARLSGNDKYLIISFPNGVNRTILIDENKPPLKTSEDRISRIKNDIERKKQRAEFQEFLKKLGLSFDIDFNQYKEDADYMTVTFKGKEIFSGSTDDLQTPKSKE